MLFGMSSLTCMFNKKNISQMNSSADYKNHMSCILRKGALWNRESKKINVLHVLLHNSAIVTCTYDPGQHFWDKFPPFPPPPITMLIFHGL